MHERIQDYAGAIILNPAAKKVLLHKRDHKAPINPSKWGFFGGGIEAGETPSITLARELREELHISIESSILRLFTDYQSERGNHRNVFLLEIQTPKTEMVLGEGEDFDWFTLEEALRLDLTRHTRQDLEYFKNNFQNS